MGNGKAWELEAPQSKLTEFKYPPHPHYRSNLIQELLICSGSHFIYKMKRWSMASLNLM